MTKTKKEYKNYLENELSKLEDDKFKEDYGVNKNQLSNIKHECLMNTKPMLRDEILFNELKAEKVSLSAFRDSQKQIKVLETKVKSFAIINTIAYVLIGSLFALYISGLF